MLLHGHAGGTVLNGGAGSMPPNRCTESMTPPRSGERGPDEGGERDCNTAHQDDAGQHRVLLIDHQVGLFTGVRDIGVAELKHNVVGLAKAAQVLGLPIVAATTARDSMWGPTVPELQAALGDLDIHDRSTVNAWDDDEAFVAKVRQTGRDHLILAGLSFEVCASLPAIAAHADGYQPVVAIDAYGTFSHHKRDAGLARLTALGIEVSDYATLMNDRGHLPEKRPVRRENAMSSLTTPSHLGSSR